MGGELPADSVMSSPGPIFSPPIYFLVPASERCEAYCTFRLFFYFFLQKCVFVSVQLTNSPPISFPVFPVWAKIVIDTVVFSLPCSLKRQLFVFVFVFMNLILFCDQITWQQRQEMSLFIGKLR